MPLFISYAKRRFSYARLINVLGYLSCYAHDMSVSDDTKTGTPSRCDKVLTLIGSVDRGLSRNLKHV